MLYLNHEFRTSYLTSLRFYFIHHRNFLDFMESHLAQQIASFDALNPLDKKLEETDPDYYYFLLDDISDRWWQYSEQFPGEFRAAYLSQLYSGIDSHVYRLCERYHKIHEPPKTFRQMSGSEWAQKSKYLKKYAKVDFKGLQAEWDFLDDVRLIRNQIVHHHSAIHYHSKDWPRVRRFIKANPSWITFKENPDEKEEGEPAYKKYPEHLFEFQITSSDIHRLILKNAEAFFNKLIPQISFVTTS